VKRNPEAARKGTCEEGWPSEKEYSFDLVSIVERKGGGASGGDKRRNEGKRVIGGGSKQTFT